MLDRRLSVAPMMDRTDRHQRMLARTISARALLYTEMVTTGAIVHGDRERHLGFDPAEHPVALQLGGSDPAALAECARIGADWGYDEINLNCGCPSDRVQSGRFGACLMAEPETVAASVAAMKDAVAGAAGDAEVTVKTRIGIDDRDSYAELCRFVETVAAAGCATFAVHARKAWLSGLSPKENRDIPPLSYDTVYRLKADYPHLAIVINGGIKTADEVAGHIGPADGVMIGRAAYENPYVLAEMETQIFGTGGHPSREEVLLRYLPYVERQRARGVPLKHMTRHLTGLFQGQRGARGFRRYLAEHAHLPGAGPETILRAARLLEPMAA